MLQIEVSGQTQIMYDKQRAAAVAKWSAAYNIEMALVAAFVKVESENFPYAERCDRAALQNQKWVIESIKTFNLDPIDDRTFCSVGLCQVLFINARSLGYGGSYEGFFNPDINVSIASKMIWGLFNSNKIPAELDDPQIHKLQIMKVISSYNQGGPYYIDKNGNGRQDPGEPFKNQDYVNAVYAAYKAMGGKW